MKMLLFVLPPLPKKYKKPKVTRSKRVKIINNQYSNLLTKNLDGTRSFYIDLDAMEG